eukprot:COSAG04_NODE_5405_length_1629_cov_12.329412_2_plen_153_part_00
MGTPRQKYFLNYDMRKLWCPEFMKGPSQVPLYPHTEPELAIARDWHGYRPLKEALLMFGVGIGGLFGLAAASAYDWTGYRARQPFVRRTAQSPRPHASAPRLRPCPPPGRGLTAAAPVPPGEPTRDDAPTIRAQHSCQGAGRDPRGGRGGRR